MVSVNNQIVASLRSQSSWIYGTPKSLYSFFKVVLQIEIRVVLRLHDRVIDGRSVNGNPTCHILILQIQLLIFPQNVLALADGRILWRFFLRRGRSPRPRQSPQRLRSAHPPVHSGGRYASRKSRRPKRATATIVQIMDLYFFRFIGLSFLQSCPRFLGIEGCPQGVPLIFLIFGFTVQARSAS